MPRKPEPKNIVLIRTDRIGEVLLSTVAVDAVRGRYPDARISFVTSSYSMPLLEDREDIEEVITFETMDKRSVLCGAVCLACMLKRKRFDTAVVFNPHKALHLGCFLAGIPRRIGYSRKWGGKLLTDTIEDEREKGEKHETEYDMDLVRLLGVEGAAPAPRLPISTVTGEALDVLLRQHNISLVRPLVVIHPGSSNPAKIWPRERYADLIRRLKTELGCDVAVLGSRKERDLAESVIFKSGVDAINLSGKLTLKEVAAFLKKAVLFIGNDTGPMHMAAALGVPVIAIFGRNLAGVSPTRWRPIGHGNIVFHEDSGCFPCYDTECPYEYKCLRAIPVSSVFEAAKKIVEKTG